MACYTLKNMGFARREDLESELDLLIVENLSARFVGVYHFSNFKGGSKRWQI